MKDALKPNRFYMLDTLRGLMIVGVVLFHFVYDMYVMGADWADTLISLPIFEFIANVGRVLFILLAGICTHLSRNNLRRGLLVTAASAVVSIATLILDLVMFRKIGEMFIYFGILHLMAACILLYALFELIFKKLFSKKRLPDALNVVLILFFISTFAATFDMYSGNLLFGAFDASCALQGTLVGAILGFSGYYPMSADYFPLIPWAFIFFAGSFMGVYFREDKVPSFLHKDICPPLTFIGNKTLIIYILHQPLIYGIALAVSYIYA